MKQTNNQNNDTDYDGAKRKVCRILIMKKFRNSSYNFSRKIYVNVKTKLKQFTATRRNITVSLQILQYTTIENNGQTVNS